MNPTIEQALQQGVAAHREGKLKEAEGFYRTILRSQPKHPDANHNLGVLAVSVNQVEVALPLFKTALEASPKVEQFWLSYIDALIKEQQFDNAERVIEQGKQQGVAGEKLNALKAKLSPSDQEENFNNAVPAQQQLDSLLDLYQSGRHDDAETLALSMTTEFPEHSFGWSILGALFGQRGRTEEALSANQRAVELAPNDPGIHTNFGALLHGLGRFEEAEASLRRAIELDPSSAAAHNNLGSSLKELGRLNEAQAIFEQAIALKSEFFEAHSNLGITLQKLGRLEEAEASYTEAIALNPDFAEAYSNFGITLQKLGRLEEAEASYTQAIALNPDFAEAHSNLGITLQKLGRLEEAEASCKRAIVLNPNYAAAHTNLGVTLKELDRLGEAMASYTQAIALKPDSADAYVNLSLVIKNVKFNSSNPKLYPALILMLTTGNFTRPLDVAWSILSLLKHDPLIKDLLLEKDVARSLKEVTSNIEALSKIPLLHHLMRMCPLPDLQFEELFVAMRRLILVNLDKMEVSSEFIYFLSTLSLHCFTNEYVYVESDEETQLIGELQAKISQTLAQSEQPEAIKILCLASYRPLHQYDWCQKLESLDNLEEVKKRLIEEPLLEKMIAKDIPVLEEISDDVSLKVREQYEENPFPRWVKLGIAIKAKSISEVCDELNIHLHSKTIKNITAPAILIAGCGTGQHAIETASRFSNCHVTAVDLSLASLAYAQRKTNELRISNLEYLQADILNLPRLDKEFDIIESAGVLHHMDEPMAGWRVLVNQLKPGGLMRIGLYSELARQHIVEIRKEITALKVGTSEADIRKFRRTLAESHNENHRQLIESGDFFTISMLRDIIFHAQEHRFTLPQIKNCLIELGLKFCGFENEGAISNFREFHGKEADIYDLELWHQYEDRNHWAFYGMYQFWCQKI